MAHPGIFCVRGGTLRCRNPLFSSNNFAYVYLMTIELLDIDVTLMSIEWLPGRAERAILEMILAERFFTDSGHLCGTGATL